MEVEDPVAEVVPVVELIDAIQTCSQATTRNFKNCIHVESCDQTAESIGCGIAYFEAGRSRGSDG